MTTDSRDATCGTKQPKILALPQFLRRQRANPLLYRTADGLWAALPVPEYKFRPDEPGAMGRLL